MRVTSVEYRRLHTFGEYENETAGVVFAVEEGDDPSAVMEIARAWVDAQLQERADGRDVATRVQRAEIRLREVNGLLQESEKRWAAAQKILAAAGVDVPKDYGAGDDDELGSLPF
jgi:hypothetical protein